LGPILWVGLPGRVDCGLAGPGPLMRGVAWRTTTPLRPGAAGTPPGSPAGPTAAAGRVRYRESLR